MVIIALWAGQHFLPGRFWAGALLGLVSLTLFGTGFSIYLTLMELFVIHAICAWCLASAVITTLIMILAVRALAKRPSAIELEVQSKQSRGAST